VIAIISDAPGVMQAVVGELVTDHEGEPIVEELGLEGALLGIPILRGADEAARGEQTAGARQLA
jgi:hypothetical protein